MQKGNDIYSNINCGNIHVTFLVDVSPLMQPSGHRMSTAIDLHQVVTSAIILLSSNTYVTLAPHRKASSKLSVWVFCTKISFLLFYFRCGKGLQSLYSSPVVKHYFNNVTLRELNSERRIYQCGALRKVNIVTNDVYAKSTCVFSVTAFWKVIISAKQT